MTYEIYRKKLSKDEYFSKWDTVQYDGLTNSLREQIYQKYLVKSNMLNRDNFECQNTECATPDSELTMHHVRWQKNGGEDKERNCVTLCKTCHKAYHRGKKSITFSADSNLPNNLKGHTFKVDQKNEINWKKVKKDMKIMRKNFKQVHGLHLTTEQIIFLMKWLEDIVDMDGLDD